MFEQYKDEYLSKTIQFVLVDQNGLVLESDNTIFAIGTGEQIADYHPFFLGLAAFFESDSKELVYRCVHLEFDDTPIITDIKMVKYGGGVLIQLHDLTEHYEEYQSVAQGRNESIIKSELIVIKNKELEEREHFKNEFIRNFSHELRNPLTNIISITNALGALDIDNQQRQMVDYLKDANSNLKLMIDDILSINMIESGKMVLRETIFDLSKPIDLFSFTYGKKAKKKGLNFSIEYDDKLPKYIEGDKLKLYQILTNLLENAIKYTEKGTVSLKISLNQKRADKASVRFIVSDTGAGIPEESQDEVFKSFSRLDQHSNEHGVGLGLAIVKGLVALMGGDIKLESKENAYSRFYFDLTFKYLLFEDKQLKEENKEVKKHSKGGKKYRLLLVEDDKQTQMSIFQTLAKTGSFFIELVDDGAKVIEELINKKYDIILMDVNLPNTSGDAVTRIIRELPMEDIRKLPIIGITSNAFEDQTKAYIQSGMNAVITKPYDDGQLVGSILKWCKKSSV